MWLTSRRQFSLKKTQTTIAETIPTKIITVIKNVTKNICEISCLLILCLYDCQTTFQKYRHKGSLMKMAHLTMLSLTCLTGAIFWTALSHVKQHKQETNSCMSPWVKTPALEFNFPQLLGFQKQIWIGLPSPAFFQR